MSGQDRTPPICRGARHLRGFVECYFGFLGVKAPETLLSGVENPSEERVRKQKATKRPCYG